MVYINLLPIREIKQRIKAIQQLTLFGVIFVSLLVAIGAFWFYQASIVSGLNNQITTLNKEKQRYNKILAQIAKLEKDKEQIEQKIAVINQLQKAKALTVHVLDDIADLTPTKRMWLTTLRQQGLVLQIGGMALDNQTIAKYMESLKASDYIADVNLINTSLKKFAGRDLKSFMISCNLKLPGTDDKEADTAETSQKK